MAVHAHHRHHGIGRALITRLCTRAFYQAMGFILARDLPGMWPDDTAVLLAKPLAQAD